MYVWCQGLSPSPLLPVYGLTSSAMAPAVLLLSPVSRTTLSPILCKTCTATGASGLMVSAITRAPNRIPGKRGDSYCHHGRLLQVNSTLVSPTWTIQSNKKIHMYVWCTLHRKCFPTPDKSCRLLIGEHYSQAQAFCSELSNFNSVKKNLEWKITLNSSGYLPLGEGGNR